ALPHGDRGVTPRSRVSHPGLAARGRLRWNRVRREQVALVAHAGSFTLYHRGILLSRRTRLLKFLKRALIAVGALVLLLVLRSAQSLGARVGGNVVRCRARAFVNGAIPGRIQGLDFDGLSFSSLQLSGIAIFDPAGVQVLSLGTLRLEGDRVALRGDD